MDRAIKSGVAQKRGLATRVTVAQSAALVLVCYGVAAILGAFLARGVEHQSFFGTALAKGDNGEYLALAHAALARLPDDPAAARAERLYLGLPLATAAVTQITGLDALYSLLLVCWVSAGLAWYLAYKLYGPPAAALMMCMDFSVMERFLYGGPEAPALFLSLLGLWLGRKKSTGAVLMASAALAAAIAVRPFALMFLIAQWIVLAVRREYGKLAGSAAVAVVFAVVYAALSRRFHPASDPLGGYSPDWYGRSPLSFPLRPIIVTLARGTDDVMAAAKQLAYIAMVVISLGLAARQWWLSESADREKLRLDALAFLLSAWFVLSYNASYGLSEFARLAILCLPFASYSIWQVLEARYRIPLRGVTIACVMVAVFSALSSHNVVASVHYLAGHW
jgi:hypothetical protein